MVNKKKYTIIQWMYNWVITLAPIGWWETFDVQKKDYEKNYKKFTQED